MDPAEPQKQTSVGKRLLVQISGYDPRGVNFYYPLFSREAEKFGAKAGIDVRVGPRSRWRRHWREWTTATNSPDHAPHVRTLFLVWDDIVRAHWHRSRFALFRNAIGTYLSYLRTGLVSRAWRINRTPLIALLFPAVGFFFIHLLFIGGFGGLGFVVAAHSGVDSWLSWPAALAGALLGAFLAHKITPFLGGTWLIQTYCFCHRLALDPIPELETRLEEQVNDLLDLLHEDPPDELLISSHSVGTIIAILFLQKFLERGSWNGRISLLTLGQTIPLATFVQPQAGWLISRLQTVATHENVDWVDFTMPSDGACFALHDPLRASVDNPVHYPNPDSPKILSARFMEGFSPDRYKALRRDKYQFHFQYLRTPDKPADFDYPDVVLGNKRLPARFHHRQNQARDPT
ncbi:MAG: hypothetical protein V4733_00970 [Verrucomicrobiota bacterium]